MASALDPALIQAYRDACYRVTGVALPFVLSVDRASTELRAVCLQHGRASAAYLTAWNPQGRDVAAAENAVAQSELRARLRALGLAVIEARTEAADGAHAEASLLVPGLDRVGTEQLGRAFGQNAVIWAGADAVPRLILLR